MRFFSRSSPNSVIILSSSTKNYSLPRKKLLFSFNPSSERRCSELMKDVKEMTYVVLPHCSRPSVYNYLSDKLNDWIIQIEQIHIEVQEENNQLVNRRDTYLDSSSNDDEEGLCSAGLDNYMLHSHEEEQRKKVNDYDDSIEQFIKSVRMKYSHLSGSIASQQEKEQQSSQKTLEDIQQDLLFLKQILNDDNNNNAKVIITRRRVRETFHVLIRQLKSDIRIAKKIQRNKRKQYQNQWKDESHLLLLILNHLDNNTKEDNGGGASSNHIYNQVLTKYQTHAGSLPTTSNRCSWKRPQRPTSQGRWKDVQTLDDLMYMMEDSIDRNIDNHSKLIASQRVCEFLCTLREDCKTEAKSLLNMEIFSDEQ